MRTATLPAVRTTPETRQLIESVLREGETLSMFIEDTALKFAKWRKEDDAFYAEAIRRSDDLKAGKSKAIPLEEVMQDLRAMVERKRLEQTAKTMKKAA